jgi:hypothetical protein
MATLSEIDTIPEALEQDLLTSTGDKKTLALTDNTIQPTAEEVGQMKQHVLNSFIGEQRIL